MEKLTERFEQLVRLSRTFRAIIDYYERSRENASDVELYIYNSSIVKHYELFYEVLWKYLKHYLKENFGLEISGSKTILRTCFERGLINKGELDTLLDTAEKRNTTVHVYDEETAEQICKEIIKDFVALEKLVERLKDASTSSA